MIESLDNVKNLLAHFESRKARATERLASDQLQNHLHFALLGIEIADQELKIGEVATLRRVIEPPGEIELAAALSDKHLLSAVGRYSRSVGHELCVDATVDPDFEKSLTLGWWLISAIRIRTGADFLVPAVCTHSWSTISAAIEGSCRFVLLEDVPLAKSFGNVSVVSAEQLNWMDKNLVQLVKLLEFPKFRLAVDCLTTHQHESSLRMATASLWAGIESLLGISAELRFRTAIMVSSFLEERGTHRISLFQEVKRLYDFRSKAVHGGAVSPDDLTSHIRTVKRVLSRLVVRIVENGSIPDSDKWEELVLT